MIVRVMPEQVSSFWPLIKGGILKVGERYVPGNWNVTNNIFNRCLAGLMQVWFCGETIEGKFNFTGFVLTSIDKDTIVDETNLMIHCVYALSPASDSLIRESGKAVSDFAKANRCKRVVFFSDDDRVKRYAEIAWADNLETKTFYMVDLGG